MMNKLSFVARRAQIPAGGLLSVCVEGRRLCVCEFEGQIYILSDICPHQGYRLSRAGCLVNGQLICGLHGSTFDLATGRSCRPPAIDALPVFQAHLKGDEVWVNLDKPGADKE